VVYRASDSTNPHDLPSCHREGRLKQMEKDGKINKIRKNGVIIKVVILMDLFHFFC
jgi:hypothetical protein